MSHHPGNPRQQRFHHGLISPVLSLLLTLIVVAVVLKSQRVEAAPSGLHQVVMCQGNLRTVGVALEMYATDHSGRYPTSLDLLLPRYLPAVPHCPVAGFDSYSVSFQVGLGAPYNLGDYQDFYYLACSGAHHRQAGLHADSPYLTSIEGVRPDFTGLATAEEKLAACRANLKTIATAAELYSIDSGAYPESLDLLYPGYLRVVPHCPAAHGDSYTPGYRSGLGAPGNTRDNLQYFNLECAGDHHPNTGRPAYNSIGGEIR